MRPRQATVPGVESRQTMPPVAHASRPLETRRSLRRSVGALAAPRRAPLRALPPHAAHRRDRPRLRRRRAASGWSASCAARCGASRRRARSSMHSPEHDRSVTRRAPRAPRRASLGFARRGSRHAARHDRPPARGGLRLPRGHREPPRVHGPLPQGLAAHARGLRGPRRRRALPPDAAASTASATTTSSFAEVEPPYRIVGVGRGGKYNRIKTFHEWTLEPASGGGTRLEYMYETEPRAPDGPPRGGARGRRGWFRRNGGKALRRLRGILEENRDRGARATVGGSLD